MGPWIVVVSELRRARETLLLRMMGRGEVLLDAIDEVEAMPDDAFERRVCQPILAELRRELARRGIVAGLTEDEMIGHAEMVARYEQEKSDWFEKGIDKALETELVAFGRMFSRRLRRDLTAAEREALSLRLHNPGAVRVGEVLLDLDADALSSWLLDPSAV